MYQINDSYITLKIGKGYNKVLSNENRQPHYTRPNEVYINGNKQSSENHYYTFTQTENTVKLVWKYTVTNCLCMFSYCGAIIEMDLSHFQTSSVGDMGNMFCGCSSLKSIDLSNINTVRVEVMKEIFKGCTSLTTLDLSNFNVRSVKNMGNMFTNCKSLKTLNLNSFFPQSAQYVDNLLKNWNPCIRYILQILGQQMF